MENIFRIAFWTIALSWMVLAAAAPTAMTSSDVLSSVKILDGTFTCLDNMTFSTPPMNGDCMRASLQCLASELYRAEVKCTNATMFEMVVDLLDIYVAKLPTPSNNLECVCDGGPRTPWGDFVSNLKTVLQMYASMQKAAGKATKG